jgi:hypothetical protein
VKDPIIFGFQSIILPKNITLNFFAKNFMITSDLVIWDQEDEAKSQMHFINANVP